MTSFIHPLTPGHHHVRHHPQGSTKHSVLSVNTVVACDPHALIFEMVNPIPVYVSPGKSTFEAHIASAQQVLLIVVCRSLYRARIGDVMKAKKKALDVAVHHPIVASLNPCRIDTLTFLGLQ